MKNGKVHFTQPAPEGCHGAPILFDDKCFAILNQPLIRELATTGNLIHTIIGKGSELVGGGSAREKPNENYEEKVVDYEDDDKDDEDESDDNNDNDEDEINLSLVDLGKFLPGIDNNESKDEGEDKPVLNRKDVDAITRAVEKGNLEAIMKMQHKVGLETLRNWRDFNGRSLVHFAAFYSSAVSLSGLKRQGYSLDSKTALGDTAVHIACYNGSLPCLKLLHKWGCR